MKSHTNVKVQSVKILILLYITETYNVNMCLLVYRYLYLLVMESLVIRWNSQDRYGSLYSFIMCYLVLFHKCVYCCLVPICLCTKTSVGAKV